MAACIDSCMWNWSKASLSSSNIKGQRNRRMWWMLGVSNIVRLCHLSKKVTVWKTTNWCVLNKHAIILLFPFHWISHSNLSVLYLFPSPSSLSVKLLHQTDSKIKAVDLVDSHMLWKQPSASRTIYMLDLKAVFKAKLACVCSN